MLKKKPSQSSYKSNKVINMIFRIDILAIAIKIYLQLYHKSWYHFCCGPTSQMTYIAQPNIYQN